MGLVVGLTLTIPHILGPTGTGGMPALPLFFVGSLLLGCVLAGRNPAIRRVMGLGSSVPTAILAAARVDGGHHRSLEGCGETCRQDLKLLSFHHKGHD